VIALRFAALWERDPVAGLAWCALALVVLVAVVDLAIVFGTGR
jgi:hypothetical protein